MQHSHPTEDAFMVPGMGAQPVPVKEYVPANDNHPDWDGIVKTAAYRFSAVHETLAKSERGQYVGLTRPGDQNGCADDLVTLADGAPLGMPADGGVISSTDLPRIIDTEYKLPRATVERMAEQYHSVMYSPPQRHGDFMQTYTGRKFFPMDPKPNEVCIRDIAHSLSLQCRYAGHCRRFYSVAEHSVHVARWLVGVAPEAALWGLLHDASEAYLIDVPRPVKPFLTGYKAAEEKVMAAVCARFGLPIAMTAAVHEADERIIADELVNLVPMDWHARHDDPLGVTLRYWSPAEAEEEFLETFKALTGAVVGEVG